MNNKEQRLRIAQDYAISRNGSCLSSEYINNKEKMTWKCSSNEHPSWQSNFDNIVNKKSWCIHCSGKKPKSSDVGLKEAQDYAISRNGLCLSTEYKSREKDLEWKCSNSEHPSWFAKTDTVIFKNSWCKLCGYTQQKITKSQLKF
jgi:hypothetical protein